jgi:phospholipase C
MGLAGCKGDDGPAGATGATGATGPAGSIGGTSDAAANFKTATAIKHLVVLFGENESFDHYFGTYPVATGFTAATGTPTVKGTPGTSNYVNGYTSALLSNNPNFTNTLNNGAPQNGNEAPVTSGGAVNPFLLGPSLAYTDDNDHDYPDEQQAFDAGAMDLFPLYTGNGGDYDDNDVPTAPAAYNTDGQVMSYYDYNTVTALWNYAQHFSMSDNSFGTTFGPSTVGAINLVSGQTNGAVSTTASNPGDIVDDGNGGFTLINDVDPTGDICSPGSNVQMTGKNIGDLLNSAGISWGFFEGGFDLTVVNPNGTTGCKRSHTSSVTNQPKADYIQHHQPFQYYATTCNPTHTRPLSLAVIGTDTTPTSTNNCTTATPTANHQYDMHDFFDAVSAGNFPAVSFLKAPGYQDAHPGYSDPLDEQAFYVQVLNFLQSQPEWDSTLVVIAYDDSDGWYDHVTNVINGSNISGVDQPICSGSKVPAAKLTDAATGTKVVAGRCGYGPRLPLLVISPYAKSNYVDHTLTDQSSITKFVEDNWLGSARIPGSFDAVANSLDGMLNTTASNTVLLLSETTGLPVTP